MAESKFKVLTNAEIKQLNREGFDLEEEKFFALSFLVNDEPNTAADPRPFKVASSFVEPLTKTGMGRPWIPKTLPNGKHVRPKKNATAAEIIEFQKKFSQGIMRGYWVNPLTQNANVIIEIFPEYIDDVRNGNIEPFVSPMIGNWKEDENGEIVEGEILHLQSVETPGYDPEFAKFLGTCEGNFNECALELEPLAAMGKIKEYRNSSISCPKKFLNTLGANGIQMSDTTNTTDSKPTGESPKDTSGGEAKIIEKLDSIQSEVTTIKESQDLVKEVIADVAVAAAGVDDAAIKEKLGMGAAGDDDPDKDKPKDEPVAAKGTQSQIMLKQKELEKELNTLKKDREIEQKDLAAKERARQVELIVKYQLLTKEIKLEDKDAVAKELMEKKSSTNPEALADLSVFSEVAEKKINSMIPEEDPLAAYGGDYLIENTNDTTDYSALEKQFS